MKRWLFPLAVYIAIFCIGNARAGDGQRLLTLNAKQIFLFVEEIQNEDLVALNTNDPGRCEIVPTGIEVLRSILNKEEFIAASGNCNYPEPKYDNCKADCKRRYPIPPETNRRPRQVCGGGCIADCLS